MKKNLAHSGLLGVAVGDALGVPVEFQERIALDTNPVVGMREFGVHNQPAGTWSDDSSLTFCLAESLCGEFNLQDIAQLFADWYFKAHWTPHGRVFDIGITTRNALNRVQSGKYKPELCGEHGEYDNGNGSLMRILPLAFYLKDIEDKALRFEIVHKVSAITHGHFRSIFSCFIYTEYLLKLFKGTDKIVAYEELKPEILAFSQEQEFESKEINLFDRILKKDIRECWRREINGSGYVLHSLEASLWCFLTHDNYKDAVLEAVNLGNDTDTTAAITGGLAGVYYGVENISEEWINTLARKEDIIELAQKLETKYF